MHYDPVMCMVVPDTKTMDATFVQLRFSSGKVEGAKLEENEYREYAEALLKKYGEKMVTLSKNGKVIATYMSPSYAKSRDTALDEAIKNCDGVSTFSFKQEVDFKGIDFTKVVKDKVANVTSNLQITYNQGNNSYYGSAVITNITSFNMLVETLAFFKEWIVMPR